MSPATPVICPFCYLGLRKLQKALSTSPHISPSPSSSSSSPSPTAFFQPPSIRFLPYELDPTLPSDHAVPKRERYIAKFGGDAARTSAMESMMKANGEREGIKFDYGGNIRNTLLSHRLMERAFAGPKGHNDSEGAGWETQLALLDKLFPHFFEHRGDPGDPAALARIAVEASVFPSEDEALKFLTESDEYGPEVQEGIQDARRKGITGVPHFEIFAGGSKEGKETVVKAEIPGAQDADTFVAVFRQLAEAYQRANGGSKGDEVEKVAPGTSAGAKC
ncbi:hypothetical protein BDZ90DRAFT_133789 [Jaminaea rosea]|uniref:DSBA-like thioredoxin domain-containing protein n=1 Tax=Jaminaea rosea TaxID=1569628 RepID=A0A316UV58_9BASI|nr:hypothetical protein BDZ90DRAFT_133789 [Jaminaea rosea]PWN28894.1 hypothetical protein BDZ90DRAFT_133789 [Jaminaea rosea]